MLVLTAAAATAAVGSYQKYVNTHGEERIITPKTREPTPEERERWRRRAQEAGERSQEKKRKTKKTDQEEEEKFLASLDRKQRKEYYRNKCFCQLSEKMSVWGLHVLGKRWSGGVVQGRFLGLAELLEKFDDSNDLVCPKDKHPLTIDGHKTSYVFIKPKGKPEDYRDKKKRVWPHKKYLDMIIMYEHPNNHEKGLHVVYLRRGGAYFISEQKFRRLYAKQRRKFNPELPKDPFTYWKQTTTKKSDEDVRHYPNTPEGVVLQYYRCAQRGDLEGMKRLSHPNRLDKTESRYKKMRRLEIVDIKIIRSKKKTERRVDVYLEIHFRDRKRTGECYIHKIQGLQPVYHDRLEENKSRWNIRE